MNLNSLIPIKIKKYLKNFILKSYEKYHLNTRHEYRDYHNLKVKIISELKRDSVCIDIGCNHGEVLETILHYSPDSKHFAFEPLPELADNLKKKFGNHVNVFDVALGDKVGTSDFTFVVSNPAYSGFKKRQYPKEEEIKIINVKTNLLDNIIPLSQKISLIKIDVEGAEYFVLKGAVETLKRNKPIVLFECGKGAADYYDIKPESIFDLLADCSLNVNLMEYYLYKKPPLDRHEFLCQFNKGYNYEFVAHP